MSDPVTRLNAALEGRYAIERELGEGGYLADHPKQENSHERPFDGSIEMNADELRHRFAERIAGIASRMGAGNANDPVPPRN